MSWLHKGNYTSLIVVVIAGTGLLFWQQRSNEQRRVAEIQARNSEPIEDWVEIKSIEVPDHALGQDALVFYNRIFKKPFTARWSASVEAIDGKQSFFCKALGGTVDYGVDYRLPPEGVSLYNKILEGVKCPWAPGEYILKTAWEIHRDGYDTKTVQQTSNVFHVLPEGAQTYVTPEQAQTLEKIK